jgi:hypothetical protein
LEERHQRPRRRSVVPPHMARRTPRVLHRTVPLVRSWRNVPGSDR